MGMSFFFKQSIYTKLTFYSLPQMQFFPALLPPPPTFMSPMSGAQTYPSQLFSNPLHAQIQQQSSVVSPANSASSLPSPTTPPQQQTTNNSPPLAPLFNKMVIGNNVGESTQKSRPELSPLQQIQLFQQQFFGSLNNGQNPMEQTNGSVSLTKKQSSDGQSGSPINRESNDKRSVFILECVYLSQLYCKN